MKKLFIFSMMLLSSTLWPTNRCLDVFRAILCCCCSEDSLHQEVSSTANQGDFNQDNQPNRSESLVDGPKILVLHPSYSIPNHSYSSQGNGLRRASSVNGSSSSIDGFSPRKPKTVTFVSGSPNSQQKIIDPDRSPSKFGSEHA